MIDTNNMETTSIVSQCGAITVAPVVSTHLTNILIEMLPFCYVAVPLIILDLYYGRKKAQYEYENGLTEVPCTIQKSVKMTIQKVFNYISWIFLSVSLSGAFGMPSLVIIIMAIIYGLEVMSLLNKYAESRGVDIDEVGMLKLLFKFIWSRLTGNFDETFDDVVKKQGEKKKKRPKRHRERREEETDMR